jgi:N-acetylmuramoyl-L-alanine amidase
VTRPFLGLALVLAAALIGAADPPRLVGAADPPADRFDTVVIDAGHGGEDRGARGAGGLLEKELVLDVARRLGGALRARGVRVVQTRDADRFVSLEERTSVANDAKGDLFVSIHANAARTRVPRGTETFFAALEPSDAAAREVAARENEAFAPASAAGAVGSDPFLALLGDLIATEHLAESSDFARLAQTRLAGESSVSRGVKQAPFVVLLGVQMPSALVEIGFVSNPEDEQRLATAARRERIAASLAEAVLEFGRRYDARRGVAGERSALPGPGEDR